MRQRARWIVGSLAVAGLAIAFLATKRPSPAPLSGSYPAFVGLWTAVDTVKPNESLRTVAGRHRTDPTALIAALRRLGIDSVGVVPGTEILLSGPNDSTVTELTYRNTRLERVRLARDGKSWSAERVPVGWHDQRSVLAGSFGDGYEMIIDSVAVGPTLTAANQRELVARLADVFAWQVDFAREVSAGDRFRAVVDLDVSNDGQQELNSVRAVELVLQGHQIEAFWFQPLRGVAGYYNAEGRSLRRPFLRAPVDFRRISSLFALNRRHPILQRIRAHRGVDYAAPEGTPVGAAGAGVVTQAGPSGDYGLLVELNHGNGVTTRYGHLSRLGPGIRVGRAVTQGTEIGLVGKSGLATAPHLHYEFRVRGEARDLRWLDVDAGESISPALDNAFQRERDQLRVLLHPSQPRQNPPTPTNSR